MPRLTCPTCHRPPSLCYCSALVRVASRLRVLIIQHPLEQKHPFNTGRMAHLCLPNSELVIAEASDEALCARILSVPSALLYPSLDWLPPVEEIVPDTEAAQALQQLVVLDGTWRKSKRMLHLNPALQRLPRVSLAGGLHSNYQVRRSSLPDSLSTVESIALALQQLEPAQDFQPLLQPFERMVALQAASASKHRRE